MIAAVKIIKNEGTRQKEREHEERSVLISMQKFLNKKFPETAICACCRGRLEKTLAVKT